MNFIKRHTHFIMAFGALYLFFLWPVLTGYQTFLFGDYWQQHYPWAFEYARQIKAGQFPFWVSNVAGGFPLAAEGQVGAYYPPHYLLYLLLPFKAAYSVNILLPFLLSGAGFYVYGLRIGLSREAAALSAVVYSFSSAYAGCFSNTAGLRVLSWLPWALVIIECIRDAVDFKRFFWTLTLGALMALMWLAGAQQLALYATVYIALIAAATLRWRSILPLVLAAAFSVMLSWPQWSASMDLFPLSVRASGTAAFALWGSVFPPAILSLIFPNWGAFMGVSFYLGAAPLILALIGLFSKKTSDERIHWALAALFLLLALGKYNPLYALTIKSLSITMLRNPSKFLFFATMSLAVLAGFGYDHLMSTAKNSSLRNRCERLSGAIAAAAALLPAICWAAFQQLRPRVERLLEQFASSAYHDKKDPLNSLAEYHERAAQVFSKIGGYLNYSNRWNLLVIVLFLVSAVLIALIARSADARTRQRLKALLWVVVLFDLAMFGTFIGSGFTGNLRSSAREIGFAATAQEPVVQEIRALQQGGEGALIEWTDPGRTEYIPANAALLFGIRHAGAYSPLLAERYYELTKDLGISDCSLGAKPRDASVWRTQLPLIRALGVGLVLSTRALDLPGLELISTFRFKDGNTRKLYRVSGALPLVVAVSHWKIIESASERLAYLKSAAFDPSREAVLENAFAEESKARGSAAQASVRIVSRTDTELIARVSAATEMLAVFQNLYYPHWYVTVNNHPAELLRVDHALSGVLVPAGDSEIRFFYL